LELTHGRKLTKLSLIADQLIDQGQQCTW